MKHFVLTTLFFTALVIFASNLNPAQAAVICWDGGGSTTNWSEDANWAGDVEPSTGDVATFDNGTCSGSPDKDVTVDDAFFVQGVNLVSYNGTVTTSSGMGVVAGSSGFTQADGTWDVNTGILYITGGNFTRTGGTFDGGSGSSPSGLVAYFMHSGTLSGSTTFNNLSFVTDGGVRTDNIASGTVLTVENTLTIDGTDDANDTLNGPGEIHAQGDIDIIAAGMYEGGSVVTTINGTGNQTITGEADTDTVILNVVIDKPSGTLDFVDTVTVKGDWTYSQGTIDTSTGTVAFLMGNSGTEISGTHSLPNIIFETGGGDGDHTILTGTILTSVGNLTLDGSTDANDEIYGPGEINVKGNISVVGSGISGDANIVANGTGAQILDGESDTNTELSAFEINKSSGTLSITDTVRIVGDWTFTQGTIDPGTSTVIFVVTSGTITGSHSLYNITFATDTSPGSRDISSGTTITALGNLVIDGTTDNNDSLNGPGGIAVQGHTTVITNGISGDVFLTFTGTGNQMFTTAGTNFLEGTITINKPSGTVTLGSNLVLDEAAGQDLVISQGTLDMGSFALTVDDEITVDGGLIQRGGNLTASNGNMTIGSTGHWTNNSVGDFVMDGSDTITNNGYVRLDGNGAGCGSTDDIALTRSGTGSVNLAGSGRWRVYDVNFSNYSASPGITVYSSTDTTGNTGITFTGTCPSERTWNGAGGDNNYNTSGNWTGNTVPSGTELAIFDATSTKSATLNVDPSDLGFQINNGFTLGEITQATDVTFLLGASGYEQNDGTFNGGNTTIYMTSGGDFTLNGGTFNSTSGIIATLDNWTINGGEFNPNSGTVYIYPQDNGDSLVTGSATYNDFYVYGDPCCNGATLRLASFSVSTVSGTLTLDGDSGNEWRTVMDGEGGVFHAKGDITILNNGWLTRSEDDPTHIIVNGTGDQTITGTTTFDFYEGRIPSLDIDKPSGTLSVVDEVRVTGNLTHIQGDFEGSTGELIMWPEDGASRIVNGNFAFDGDFGIHFNNCCSGTTITMSSGSDVTIRGNFDISVDSGGNDPRRILGPGSLTVEGDVTKSGTICQSTCSMPIIFGGSQDSTLTISGTGWLKDAHTVSKEGSAKLILGSALNLSESGQDLTVNSGILDNSSFNLAVNDTLSVNGTGKIEQGTGNITSGTFNIGVGGTWENTSTGDVIVGAGGVINNGRIAFGDALTCGTTDEISITSSSSPTQRSWSGSGAFELYDVSVTDQGGSASITVYSGTSVSNNDTNWTFNASCPAENPNAGTRVRGGNLRLRGGTTLQ